MREVSNYLEFLIGQDDNVKNVVNVSAGVIYRLDDNGEREILLIQRSKDDHWPSAWEFPRGKCDKGPNEKLLPCLEREVKEEIGIDVVPIKLIDKFEYLADMGKRKSIQHNFLCKMKNPEDTIKLSKEHQEYRWIKTAGEVEVMVYAGEMKRTLMKVFDNTYVVYPDNEIEPVEKIEEMLLNRFLGE